MEESLIWEGKLSIEECANVIFKIHLNRSPGYDDITVEFYRQFWESLKDFIVPVFNYNYDRKELPQSQILGMLTIICKKHDPLSLSNYRLITLLITDTKLIAYAYLLTLPLFAGVSRMDWVSCAGDIFLPHDIPPTKKSRTIKSWTTFCDQYFWKFPIWNSRADEKRREIRM